MNYRAGSYFIRVFMELPEHLLTRGLNPAYTILDNKYSHTLKIELKAKNIDFQLDPPRNVFPQCSRICNQHLQESIHRVALLNRPLIPHEKLGPPFRTGGDHT